MGGCTWRNPPPLTSYVKTDKPLKKEWINLVASLSSVSYKGFLFEKQMRSYVCGIRWKFPVSRRRVEGRDKRGSPFHLNYFVTRNSQVQPGSSGQLLHRCSHGTDKQWGLFLSPQGKCRKATCRHEWKEKGGRATSEKISYDSLALLPFMAFILFPTLPPILLTHLSTHV